MPYLLGKGRSRFGILRGMTIEEILASIDDEIARLRKVRALLSTGATETVAPVRKGRHKLSAEARTRIAEAQRKRWAKQKAAK